MGKLTSSQFLELKKQKAKNKFLLFLDNIKVAYDALKSGQIVPFVLLSSSEEILEKFKNLANFSQKNEDFLGFFDNLDKKIKFEPKILLAKSQQIEALSSTKSCQDIVLVAKFVQRNYDVLNTDGNILVLDKLQDAGNCGTLIRSAYASGFEAVVCIDCVHKTNPKLVRSSASAVFLMPVLEMSLQNFLQDFSHTKFDFLCCDMHGKNIFNYKSKGRVAVVVGNEGNGVCKEVRSMCKETVSIPMQNGIESLNASVSGSIIMFQINKQKFD